VIDIKDRVATAIVNARADLEQALGDLERLPAFDPGAVVFAAHALTNYLTVAEGTVDLLLLALADHPNAQVRSWLEGVHQTTSLMSHIAGELMKHASITSAPKLRFDKLDLPLLVQRACAFYRRKADRKKIRITWESQVTHPFVRADRVAVAAVLDNLLSNAVKYSLPDKQIRVTVREEPAYLVCSVQDEGPGLSLEDQSKLFQKGVCLSAVPTGGEPATGYGLAVAKELMGLLGGAIWCESRPGQGACFLIGLPKYQEPPGERPAPEASGPGPGKPGAPST
jgi:signal transduction histidine kinase